MRHHRIFLIIFLTACSSRISNHEMVETIEGIARESKAGLVVGGVVLMDLDYRKIELYRDRKIYVRGVVTENHPWRTDTDSDEPIKTGINMPVMMKVLEIRLVEKNKLDLP